MTIQAFLEALTTAGLATTITNGTKNFITFQSEGYEGVEGDLLARDVDSWDVNGRNLKVVTPKQTGTLNVSKSTMSLSAVGDTDTATYSNATGDVTAVSSDETVATVSIEGTTITVEEVGAGTATITVTSAEADDYTAATKTIAVTCAE